MKINIGFMSLLLGAAMLAGCAEHKKIIPVNQNILSQGMQEEKSVVDSITEVLAQNMNKLPNKRLAVSDFTDILGNDTEEGKLLSEQIITKLSQNPNIIVVERKQLQKVLEEQKLALSGATETDTQNVGKLLNVDAIVSGTIAHLDDYEEINARMIDVKTGQIYCAVNPKQKVTQRKQEFEKLDPEIRSKLDNEFDKRAKESNPLVIKQRKEMLALRENDPSTFRDTIRVIREVQALKNDRPRLFVMLTEPENSQRLTFLAKRNPGIYRRIMGLREKLETVYKNTPSYKDIILLERKNMIDSAPVELNEPE
ncbi:MAG: CsgG/HfaB family protein [Elusimicrobia bacterium]|nr:CsgG/HfaB family protein [Candidatus Liberimonas magnetica]